MVYYFLQSNSTQEYDYLINRFNNFGLRLDKVSKTSGYDFSEAIELGEIIHSKPTISCYIPKDNVWEELCVGTAYLSAGSMPEFLQEVCNLMKKGKLSPRPEDLQSVKELFLFKQRCEWIICFTRIILIFQVFFGIIILLDRRSRSKRNTAVC